MFEGPGGRDKADNHTSQREGGDKADLLNLDQATHSLSFSARWVHAANSS